MSLLVEFERQYSVLTAEITSEIGRIVHLKGVAKHKAVELVERQLNDVAELLEQMELAVRDLNSASDKQKYSSRLKSYRGDKEHLHNELRKHATASSDDRDELFGYEGGSFDDQRQMLLDNTERLERSSRKLDQGYKVAIETEQVGAEILSNLESQRHTLQRARDRLKETETDLSQSSRLLSTMIRRVIQNRALLLMVAVFFVIIIIVAIYVSATK